MPPRTVKSTARLGNAIKARRISLGLSIEEASRLSGVGAKTWGNYESGQAIRSDKVAGVCKALKWKELPIEDGRHANEYDWLDNIGPDNAAWSATLARGYGRKAAVSFVVGSDLLLDYLSEDLEALKEYPVGTHLAEIPCSYLADMMPAQYSMEYDFRFLFRFRAATINYRNRMGYGHDIRAHTVAEELIVRLVRDLSFDAVRGWTPNCEVSQDTDVAEESTDFKLDEAWEEWPEDLCEDDDVSIYLNDDHYTQPGDPYSFELWFEAQFWTEQN